MGITNFSFSLVHRYSNDFNLNLEESKGSWQENGTLAEKAGNRDLFSFRTGKNQRHIYNDYISNHIYLIFYYINNIIFF